MSHDTQRHPQQGRAFSLVFYVWRGKASLAINWGRASLNLDMPCAWPLVSFFLAVMAIGPELLR